MHKTISLGAIVAVSISGAAFGAENVSHSFVEAGYGYSEFVGGAAGDGDGFKVGASFDLPANIIVAVNYRDFSYDGFLDGGLSELSAGVGYKWALGSSFDLVTGASFEQLREGVGRRSPALLRASAPSPRRSWGTRGRSCCP